MPIFQNPRKEQTHREYSLLSKGQEDIPRVLPICQPAAVGTAFACLLATKQNNIH